MVTLLLVTLACCAAALAVAGCVSRVESGLIGLFAVELFELTFGRDAAVIGRLHLSALDAISTILLVAGVIRFVRGLPLLTPSRLLSIGYALLFATSFARGVNANGIFAAANEARGFVGPLSAMLYFADAPVDEASVRRYLRCYLLFGIGLCALAALAVAGLPVGTAAWAHSSAEMSDHRVLPSSAAAVIAVCGFFSLARSSSLFRGRIASLWPTLFFLAAIYLRHRTVWVMVLAGAVVIFFTDSKIFRKMAPVLLLASAAVAGLVMLEGDQTAIANQSDFIDSLSSTETWQWRVNGWQEFLFDSDQSPLNIGTGKPMGSGWWHIDPESHRLQTAPPHSEYVTEYLRVGILGLLIVMMFAWRPVVMLVRAPNKRQSNDPSGTIWATVALITLIYGTTYSIEPECYALIGIASAIAKKNREFVAVRHFAAPGALLGSSAFSVRTRSQCAHP
ncbi:MAG TPA: hypothetical protein VHZ28_16300 [Terracidiphilus sp.]|nr:hypothetical protein [Terracidiphilus sp.]